MERLVLLVTVCGAVLGVNSNELQSQLSPAYWRTATSGGERVYWPFEKARGQTETRFNLPPPQSQGYVQIPTSRDQTRDLILRRRQYKESSAYPIVLTQGTGAVADALTQADSGYDQYGYRPTQLAYESPSPAPPSAPRRPVISIGPQPKLAYGEPFLRVPYENVDRRQPPRTSTYRPNSNREFGPFGVQGPYRPTSIPTYADRPPLPVVREYGPFGGQGPYAYAPSYRTYIPTLRFSHQQNHAAGQYDVEFQTGNGIYRKETGYIKRISAYNPTTRQYEERLANVKEGQVSWTSPEGIPFSYSFIADEKGYRPTPLVQALAPKALPLAKAAGYETVIPYP